MTSMDDLKKGGATCGVVATDFWECKAADGKVWWCSNHGKDCMPRPFVRPPWRFIRFLIRQKLAWRMRS